MKFFHAAVNPEKNVKFVGLQRVRITIQIEIQSSKKYANIRLYSQPPSQFNNGCDYATDRALCQGTTELCRSRYRSHRLMQ